MTSFIGNWLVQWFFAGLLLGAGFVWPMLWTPGVAGIVYVIISLYVNSHTNVSWLDQ